MGLSFYRFTFKHRTMSKHLFSEFPSVSAKAWKQKIQVDLKGADYNETLVWTAPDGIDVKPFYHPDQAPEPLPIPVPGHWKICESVYAQDAAIANKIAKNALDKGAESLAFTISTEEIQPHILLEGIPLERCPVYLELNFHSKDYLDRLHQYLAGKDHQIYLLIDSIGKLARTGNWYFNLNQDHEILEAILKSDYSFQSIISVNLGLYQNAGATIPQQLAYTLAHLNEYFNYFSQPPSRTLKGKIVLKTATGPNYFFEIAKLRALRLLYSSLAREYGLREDCHILAQPSKRNKTLYDYNVNMLRTTTESMSAVLGGADSVCNLPYDAIFHKSNAFGNRIARNQLLILKHESYFEKAANPAEGSYYIEELTRSLAQNALDIFKSIEKGGGFLKQLKNGIIQKKIAQSADREQALFDEQSLVLIGTNKFLNPEDQMHQEIEIYPFLKKRHRKTLLPPILERRLSEQLEEERLKEEQTREEA